MSARAFVLLLGLGFASATRAEVVVELVPDNPGPYTGGESLTVDVWLHSEASDDFILTLIQFAFQVTDPGLSLGTTFTFDFTSLGDQTNYYSVEPELPVPWTWNGIGCVCPWLFLQFPAGTSLHIGSVGLQLPTAPGSYRLDALNADEPDLLLSAWISAGSSCSGCPSDRWEAFTGEITGGVFEFVIPPPIPTLSGWGVIVLSSLLLTAGWLVITRRRPADV